MGKEDSVLIFIASLLLCSSISMAAESAPTPTITLTADPRHLGQSKR